MFFLFYIWMAAWTADIRSSPVPVIQLNLGGHLFQGDVAVVPEGNLHHLPDQLLQLALQLLDDRQVVCMLRVLGLKLLQIVIHCLVQRGCTVVYLAAQARGQIRSGLEDTLPAGGNTGMHMAGGLWIIEHVVTLVLLVLPISARRWWCGSHGAGNTSADSLHRKSRRSHRNRRQCQRCGGTQREGRGDGVVRRRAQLKKTQRGDREESKRAGRRGGQAEGG